MNALPEKPRGFGGGGRGGWWWNSHILPYQEMCDLAWFYGVLSSNTAADLRAVSLSFKVGGEKRNGMEKMKKCLKNEKKVPQIENANRIGAGVESEINNEIENRNGNRGLRAGTGFGRFIQ